jgi:hypothetical protein
MIVDCNHSLRIFAEYCRFQPDIFSLGKVQEVTRNPHRLDSKNKVRRYPYKRMDRATAPLRLWTCSLL